MASPTLLEEEVCTNLANKNTYARAKNEDLDGPLWTEVDKKGHEEAQARCAKIVELVLGLATVVENRLAGFLRTR
ncbi:MAG: hypothetical protein V1754_15835 [Pseudomonadota bacterium]